MIPLLSRDPLYLQYANLPSGDARPLGGGPATYRTIPRMQTKVDARTLGYTCPTTAIDMQIARREGDDSNAGKPPHVVPGQEQS
jgi:hypothetical protein